MPTEQRGISPIVAFCLSAVFGGSIAAILALPWYEDISLWVAIAIVFCAGITGHFFAVRQNYPPLIHITILVAFLQLVFAACYSRYLAISDYQIFNDLPEGYFLFSVPFVIALSLGLFVAMAGWQNQTAKEQADENNREQLIRSCKYMLFSGILLFFLTRVISIPGFAFLMSLLINLRFVGGFGLLLLNAPHWRIYLIFLFGLELLLSTGSGFFHSLTLWGASFIAVWIYSRRPNFATVALLLTMCVAGIVVLEYAKIQLRHDLWNEEQTAEILNEESSGPVALQTTGPWGGYLFDGFINLLTWGFDDNFKIHLSNRYNQGWIVGQVMEHVPVNEPYAHGETVMTAAYAAFLPRIFAPNKYVAGGQSYMLRFAGIRLNEGTSMNIGLAGEYYANFGSKGAIISAFIHGLFLGLVFRGIGRLAQRNQVFWAFAPFILFWAFKSEEGLGEMLNWISKSSIVMAGVIFLVPAFRNAALNKPAENTVTEP